MNGVEITAHEVTECCLRLKAIFSHRIYSIIKFVLKLDTTGVMSEVSLEKKKKKIVGLNLLIDSVFLILSLSLLHPLIHYEKKKKKIE